MVVAQDPRLEFRWDSHDRVLCVGFGGPGAAGNLAAHGLNSDDHNTGSTIADGVQAPDCPAAIVARAPSPDPWSAQHSIDAGVNRDASLYFAAPGSCAIAPHVSPGHDGSPGSAAPPHAATAGARVADTWRSRYAPNRRAADERRAATVCARAQKRPGWRKPTAVEPAAPVMRPPMAWTRAVAT